MKTRTLTVGLLCVLAVCVAPFASADISAKVCTDQNQKVCYGNGIGTDAASCHEKESPFNGSIVDQPQCTLNF